MSTLSVKAIDPATCEDWDRAWLTSQEATYFHSREWLELWECYSNGRITPSTLRIEFTDGQSCIFPCSKWNTGKGIWEVALATPGGNYGGVISQRKINNEYKLLATEAVFRHHKNLILRSNPIDIKPLDAMAKHFEGKIEKDTTQILALREGFSPILAGWSKGHAAAARQAKRSGVTVHQASSLNEWQEYYAVYQDSLRRWGKRASSNYDWSFFELCAHLKSPWIKLWLAKTEHKIIAGALCFYSPHHVVYWHGAALSEHFKLRPVHWLLHEVIQNACENGYEWFDFNPSSGHSGVAAFKKSFGTTEFECPVFYQLTPSFRTYRAVSRWLECLLGRGKLS